MSESEVNQLNSDAGAILLAYEKLCEAENYTNLQAVKDLVEAELAEQQTDGVYGNAARYLLKMQLWTEMRLLETAQQSVFL